MDSNYVKIRFIDIYGYYSVIYRTVMNGLLLAFDFGIRSIGVAVGQCVTGTAYPLSALKAKKGVPNYNLMGYLFREWKPNEVIVGLPLNMNGTEQPVTALTYRFANKIQFLFNIKVSFHDERLSTAEARSKLFERGGFRVLEKGKIDSVSAVLVLESYLSKKK